MVIAGFGKGLRDKLEGAAQSAKEAVEGIDLSGVKEKLQETVDLSTVKDKLHETGDAVMETVKKVGVPNTVSDDPEDASTPGQEKDTVPSITAISTRNAIKIVYYLMAADGTICHGEEEKFDSIASEIDPRYMDNREQIIAECQSQLDKTFDPEDYYDVLREGVEDALADTMQTADAFITPKLLVWDLLTVAYSDENYDEAERRLVKYIVRQTNIDKAVFLEMESSILTLMDIEKELVWIKTTDRPYLVIEAMVNELADRKSVIFESVKDLISL